jgi:hypothetical protein
MGVKYYELLSLQNEIVIGGSRIPGVTCNIQHEKGQIISSISLLNIREFN